MLDRPARGLRFLHIPKTAGTTFKEYLISQHPAHRIVEFQPCSEWGQELINQRDFRSTPLLVLGHAPRDTDVAWVNSLPTVAFLRNPMERVISFCQHVNEGKSPQLRHAFAPGKLDLDRFLDSGYIELSNLQVRMLTQNFSWNAPRTLGQSDLDEAIACLDSRISAFGLTERFYQSLFLMAIPFGWKLPQYSASNTAAGVVQLNFSPAHIDRIRRLNELDMQLYEFAAQKFDRVLNALSQAHERELQNFMSKIDRQRVWSRRRAATVSTLRKLKRKLIHR